MCVIEEFESVWMVYGKDFKLFVKYFAVLLVHVQWMMPAKKLHTVEGWEKIVLLK